MNFKKGDRIRCKKGEGLGFIKSEGVYIFSNYDDEGLVVTKECGGGFFEYRFEKVNEKFKTNNKEQPKKEKEMNSTIVKLFEKTADAVLVDKHLSQNIGENPVSLIMLEGKQEELLKAAQELEDKEKV